MSLLDFFKTRYTETFDYYSESPHDKFVEKLYQLLKDKQVDGNTVNIIGDFLSDDSFEATRVWEFGPHVTGVIGKKKVYLSGQFFPDGKGTRVVIKVINPLAPFIALVAIGCILVSIFNKTEKVEPWIRFASPIAAILVPILPLQMGYWSKNRLRDSFAHYLNLISPAKV